MVCVRQRLMSWPRGIYGLVFAAIFGGLGLFSLRAYPNERLSAWLAAPMYGLVA